VKFRTPSSGFSRENTDWILLILVVSLVFFGLIMVYSASFIYAQEKTGDGFSLIRKQVFFAFTGFLALASAYRIDYRRWEKWAYPVLGISVFLLILVMVPGIGSTAGGARRWLQLGGLHLQPAEFAKFAVIFFAARQLSKSRLESGTWPARILSLFIAPLPIMVLLLLQPDFGTTVIISWVTFSLLFLAGVPLRYFTTVLLSASMVGGWLALGTAYRRSRVLAFLDPWSDPAGKGFQILQSFVGLHQGKLFGVGLGNGKEKLFYLPEAHNDFILSVIGEELGFFGIAMITLAFLYLIYRGLRIGWISRLENEHNGFGLFLATGITLVLGLQGFVNIAVVLGLLPTKGLTLPFISYGGSALVADLFAVGILLNISRNNSQKGSKVELKK
jgi:cell division protein FtsW